MQGYVKEANDFVENRRIGKAAAALLVDFCYHLEKIYPFEKAAQHGMHGDSALPEGHSGSSLECMHPFCVAERESPSA